MTDEGRKRGKQFQFDRHAEAYRQQFDQITSELQSRCPIAWTDTYDGHWVASGNREVFELARNAEVLSSDHDITNERGGPRYQGITIPSTVLFRAVFQEMDPPEQRYYRQALNPYLSPAAVARWLPVAAEITRAAIDEKVESGRIDFVDDLANIVPAVLTLAMLGLPLRDWQIYCEPTHAGVYTKPDSAEMPRIRELTMEMFQRLLEAVSEARTAPRPGLIDALVNASIDGRSPSDEELASVCVLLIGGGFDTTTALTAHALEYLSENPADRERLSTDRETLLDSATEEFLRFYTPAPGIARTFKADCELLDTEFHEGDRLWLSWAMANRDPAVFPDPNEIDLARANNRHTSFGLGLHRCIGSNVARMTFKQMLVAVLDRMPDFHCETAGAVHYDTIGVINGMKHLPASFTPGPRVGAGLDETIETLQRACDEQGLAQPITRASAAARP
jgi:cytochrome P450